MCLVDDLQAATLHTILSEATQKMQTFLTDTNGQANVHVTTFPEGSVTAPSSPLWISPAPISIKMRLFCIPYAGGVSENIFAR